MIEARYFIYSNFNCNLEFVQIKNAPDIILRLSDDFDFPTLPLVLSVSHNQGSTILIGRFIYHLTQPS